MRWLAVWAVLSCGCGGEAFLAERVRVDAARPSDAASPAQFPDPATLAVNGSARIVDGVLRLTEAQPDETGSAFLREPVPTSTDARWQARFAFRVVRGSTSSTSADGMAFVLQTRGTDALAGSGGGLGYRGLAPSVAVELDIHPNQPDETVAGTVAIVRDGQTTRPLVELPYRPLFDSVPVVFVWVDYDGPRARLDVFVANEDQKPAVPLLGVDAPLSQWLGESAFVGFTASTGTRFARHEVLSFSWSEGDASR